MFVVLAPPVARAARLGEPRPVLVAVMCALLVLVRPLGQAKPTMVAVVLVRRRS